MKKFKPIHLTAMIIGLISIAFGIYAGINGNPFMNYFIKLFIGFSLLGVGGISNLLTSNEIKTDAKKQVIHQI